MDKLVSVIMPAYNCETTIETAVQSVIAQSYSNWELIVINDGSKDMTWEILQNYMSSDERIKCISIENCGVSNARNVGLNSATGDYIMFIDSDDQYLPNAIKLMVNDMQMNGSDLACAGYNSIELRRNETFVKSRIPIKNSYDRAEMPIAIYEMQKNILLNSLWNKIFKRKIISDNRLEMDVKCDIGEDFKFVVGYLVHCYKISTLPFIIYHYHVGEWGLNRKHRADIFDVRINQMNALLDFFRTVAFKEFYLYDEYLRICYVSISEVVKSSKATSGRSKIGTIRNIMKNSTIESVVSNDNVTTTKFHMYRLALRYKNPYIMLLIHRLI